MTTEEGKRLGVEDVLLVARVREHRKASSSDPSLPDLQDDFSLRVFKETQAPRFGQWGKILEGEPTPTAGGAAGVDKDIDSAQAMAKELLYFQC